MKKPYLLTVLVLLALLLTGSVWAAPRLTIPETAFNFGFAPQNAKISHEFWLYSDGDELLKIIKVVPG